MEKEERDRLIVVENDVKHIKGDIEHLTKRKNEMFLQMTEVGTLGERNKSGLDELKRHTRRLGDKIVNIEDVIKSGFDEVKENFATDNAKEAVSAANRKNFYNNMMMMCAIATVVIAFIKLV